MKKIAVLAILLGSLLPSRVPGLGLVLGIKGGASIDSYFGSYYWSENMDDGLDGSWKVGFAAGLFCTLDLGSVFSLQPELLLVQAGNAATESALYWGPYNGSVRHVDVLTYLSIPVLMKVRLRFLAIYLGADTRLRIGSGVARLEAEDETLQQSFETAGLDSMRYADDRFAPLTFAAVLGLEYVLPFKFLKGEWGVEARSQYTFTNLLGESQASVFNAVEVAVMLNYGLRVLGSRTYAPRGKQHTRIR